VVLASTIGAREEESGNDNDNEGVLAGSAILSILLLKYMRKVHLAPEHQCSRGLKMIF
jgi:hypothetical protein